VLLSRPPVGVKRAYSYCEFKTCKFDRRTSAPASGKARKLTLDEMGPGAHKESLPYRPGPGGGPRPRSTAGKGGTRVWRGKRR
jgi:hypothetical protein